MKKIVSIMSIIVIIVAMVSTTVWAAAPTLAIALSVDNKEVYQGDEITLTLRVKDFKDMTEGVMGYTAKIEYDTGFFETLSQSSFATKGTWSAPTFNPDTNLLAADSSTGVKTDSDVFTVKLKVKANALIGGKTTVKITTFKAAESKTEIKAEDASVEISVKEKTTEEKPPVTDTNNLKPDTNNALDITDTNTTNKINNTTNNTNTINNTKNTVNNTNTNTSGGNIPQTGEEDWIFVALIATVVIGVVSFVRYRKIK